MITCEGRVLYIISLHSGDCEQYCVHIYTTEQGGEYVTVNVCDYLWG